MSAVMWLEGFDNEQVDPVLGDAYLEFDIGNGGFVPGRAGAGSAFLFPTDILPIASVQTLAFPAAPLAQLSAGFYVNFAGTGNGVLEVAVVRSGGAGVSFPLIFKEISPTQYRITSGNQTDGTGGASDPLPKGEWIQVEFRAEASAISALGRIKVYLNGFLIFDIEQASLSGTLEGIRFRSVNVNPTDVIMIDDIYVNDALLDDPALPDYQVIGILPESDGAFRDSTPSTGTVRAEVIDNPATDPTPDADSTEFPTTGADSYVLDKGTADYRRVLAAQCRPRAAGIGSLTSAEVRLGTDVVGILPTPSVSFTQQVVDLALPVGTTLRDLAVGDLGVKAS